MRKAMAERRTKRDEAPRSEYKPDAVEEFRNSRQDRFLSSLSANLNVMIQAVQKAGRGLMRDFGELEKLQISKKGAADFASSADINSERTLREFLLKAPMKSNH